MRPRIFIRHSDVVRFASCQLGADTGCGTELRDAGDAVTQTNGCNASNVVPALRPITTHCMRATEVATAMPCGYRSTASASIRSSTARWPHAYCWRPNRLTSSAIRGQPGHGRWRWRVRCSSGPGCGAALYDMRAPPFGDRAVSGSSKPTRACRRCPRSRFHAQLHGRLCVHGSHGKWRDVDMHL